MTLPRRRLLLGGAAAAVGAPSLLWHRAGHAQGTEAAEATRHACGVASGYPRPDGMVLWTRLTGPGLPPRVEVQWEVAHDDAFTHIAARGTETAEAAWAHSVHAEPSGLEPGRWFHYRFTALGERSPVGRTRTAPPADATEPLNFAIASCQRYDAGHYAAWRDVAAFGPDLVLFLGDYIYEGGSTRSNPRAHAPGDSRGIARTLAHYRARHAQYKSDPLLQAAHAAAPWALVWDDHEVHNDYAGAIGPDPAEDFSARRAAAYQAYWEHQPLPKSMRPRGAALPLHTRLDWGRLARIHLLDTRQHRDLQACGAGRSGGRRLRVSECEELPDPRRSLLGAAQERWLAEGWSLDRPWNLLAQQTLMSRMALNPVDQDPMFWNDGWEGYAPARRRLLQGAAERRVPGLVALGGDVHAHYVSPLKVDYDDERSPAIGAEFCGTSISSRGPAQWQIDALRQVNPHLQHGSAPRGSVLFRLDARALQADLRAVERPEAADSAVRSAARYVVTAGRAGAQPA